jgi:hypothetical protein
MNNQLNLTSTTLLKDLNTLLDELIESIGGNLTDEGAGLESDIQPIRIRKQGTPHKVASLDSTCITLANTITSLTLAARATVVTNFENRGYHCVRSSPIIREFSNLESSSFLLTQERAESILRSALELCIVKRLVEERQSEMIFMDGVLDEPMGGPFREFKRRLIAEALAANIDLIGFSKESRLTSILTLLSQSYNIPEDPWFAYVAPLSLVCGGEGSGVYVAKLAEIALAIRVDVVSRRLAEDVFADLLASDNHYRGYPESLRLAHHLTVFTALEALTLKAAAKKVDSPLNELGSRRSLLLGSIKPR